jgi:hypothetical protein
VDSDCDVLEGVLKRGTTVRGRPRAGRGLRPSAAALEGLLDLRQRRRLERLRAQLCALPGVREALYYHSTSWGWAWRYRAGRRTLLTLHLLSGNLEACVPLDHNSADALVANRHLPRAHRRAIASAQECKGMRWARLPLLNAADLNVILRLIALQRSAT